MEEGDILTYKTKFYTRNYKLDNIKVIYETDWSLLQPTKENKLTLITCVEDMPELRRCIQAIEVK